MDLISIIIPVYKAENTLDICVKSVVNQTYKKLEIILIDDGSPDQCPYICDKWKSIDSRIKVVHKQNGGPSDARNCGLKIAQGEFIGFIDSDDYVSPLFIECLYNILKTNKADISIVGYRKVYDLKPISDKVARKKSNTKIFTKKEALIGLFSGYSYSNYVCNKLFSRELFDDLQFPLGRKMEDLGTTYKLFLKCEKIVYTPIPLYYYYQHPDSILHTQDKNFAEDLFVLSLERYDTLKKLYPDLKGNAWFMFNVLLQTFPYLNNDIIPLVHFEMLLKETFQNAKKTISIKQRIKYRIFLQSKHKDIQKILTKEKMK